VTNRDLQKIYDSLPNLKCKGLCHEACGPIEIFKAERDNLGRSFKHKNLKDVLFHLKKRHTDDYDGCITCPMLTGENKCSVYDKRPVICRLWGLVENMKCKWGCIPDRYLSVEECDKYLELVKNLR
jgi:uncharacterized protein